jgi:hypothetical protein
VLSALTGLLGLLAWLLLAAALLPTLLAALARLLGLLAGLLGRVLGIRVIHGSAPHVRLVRSGNAWMEAMFPRERYLDAGNVGNRSVRLDDVATVRAQSAA